LLKTLNTVMSLLSYDFFTVPQDDVIDLDRFRGW